MDLFVLARQPPVDQGPIIHEVSRSDTTDTKQLVGLLWTSDRLVTETSTWQQTTLTTDRHPCPAAGFEPTNSAGERPLTYSLERAASGTGTNSNSPFKYVTLHFPSGQ